jgi:hypothetical protein
MQTQDPIDNHRLARTPGAYPSSAETQSEIDDLDENVLYIGASTNAKRG